MKALRFALAFIELLASPWVLLVALCKHPESRRMCWLMAAMALAFCGIAAQEILRVLLRD